MRNAAGRVPVCALAADSCKARLTCTLTADHVRALAPHREQQGRLALGHERQQRAHVVRVRPLSIHIQPAVHACGMTQPMDLPFRQVRADDHQPCYAMLDSCTRRGCKVRLSKLCESCSKAWKAGRLDCAHRQRQGMSALPPPRAGSCPVRLCLMCAQQRVHQREAHRQQLPGAAGTSQYKHCLLNT